MYAETLIPDLIIAVTRGRIIKVNVLTVSRDKGGEATTMTSRGIGTNMVPLHAQKLITMKEEEKRERLQMRIRETKEGCE